MRRRTAVLLMAVCAIVMPAAAAPQKPAAKYDQQILQDVNKYIQGKKEFQGVKAAVEDQIVTLDGTVNLYIDRENLEKKVKKMKNEPGEGMVILGSGTIVSQLTEARLIDEYQLIFNPIVLGDGRTLFAGLKEKVTLKRTKTRAFENGNVVMAYEPQT